jgi:hypothetical protein
LYIYGEDNTKLKKACVWSFCHYLDNKICLN